MSRCKSCNAEFYWSATANKKAIPIDIKPTADGNIIIEDGIAHVLPKDGPFPEGKLRWTSHFVTCVGAAKHRKGK